ncbi:MAG: dTMP kinase [Ignavibacteria bacterium]|nr:dTMP kinase [Ignavibacteria bacterium]
MFITFEGIDASGKSTHVKLLEKYFLEQGRKVIIVREPGGTKVSEEIRKILLSKKNLEMVRECEIFLFCASRTQLVQETILPKLKEGYVVISDRFHDSTTAYQGAGREISPEDINTLHKIAIDGCLPHLTFFIDIEYEEALRRQTANKKSHDRIESTGKEFFDRVRDGYVEISKREPNRVHIINGYENVNKIHEKIVNIIKEKMELDKSL